MNNKEQKAFKDFLKNVQLPNVQLPKIEDVCKCVAKMKKELGKNFDFEKYSSIYAINANNIASVASDKSIDEVFKFVYTFWYDGIRESQLSNEYNAMQNIVVNKFLNKGNLLPSRMSFKDCREFFTRDSYFKDAFQKLDMIPIEFAGNRITIYPSAINGLSANDDKECDDCTFTLNVPATNCCKFGIEYARRASLTKTAGKISFDLSDKENSDTIVIDSSNKNASKALDIIRSIKQTIPSAFSADNKLPNPLLGTIDGNIGFNVNKDGNEDSRKYTINSLEAITAIIDCVDYNENEKEKTK